MCTSVVVAWLRSAAEEDFTDKCNDGRDTSIAPGGKQTGLFAACAASGAFQTMGGCEWVVARVGVDGVGVGTGAMTGSVRFGNGDDERVGFMERCGRIVEVVASTEPDSVRVVRMYEHRNNSPESGYMRSRDFSCLAKTLITDHSTPHPA